MWMVVKLKRKAEGGIMLLQQCISVPALVERRYCGLQLLEPCLLRLLDAPPTSQVALHYPLHRRMETQVATLPGGGGGEIGSNKV